MAAEKKVTRWVFICADNEGFVAWRSGTTRTRAAAERDRKDAASAGFRCSPIVKLEIPATKKVTRG